jgi:hypothetical protein
MWSIQPHVVTGFESTVQPGVDTQVFVHVGQAVHEPPQSTPVSSPFWVPSAHVGHAEHEPPQSTPVSSPFWVPSAHVGHAEHEPPQSTPVSSPFWVPSAHVDGGQIGSSFPVLPAAFVHPPDPSGTWQTQHIATTTHNTHLPVNMPGAIASGVSAFECLLAPVAPESPGIGNSSLPEC